MHHGDNRYMTHRKLTIWFVCVLAGFVLLHFAVWKLFTEDILSNRYEGGDLVRVGYISGSKIMEKTHVDLPKKHIEMSDYRGQKIDVLTIGDSFSAGGGFRRNSYYQDYIATRNNFTVLNAGPYPTDDLFAFFQPLSTLSVLYNSGYLDVIKPRYILIESVARYSVHRFAKPLNFSRQDSLEKVMSFYNKKYDSHKAPDVFFFNNGNLKFVLNRILYRFSDSAFSNMIHVKKLNQPLFSVENSDSILFLHEDIKYIKEVNLQSVAQLNDNFNRIAELLERKGIKLIFMPIVDKYDLYSNYMVDNSYPSNTFFETLRKLPRNYTLIDTKEILSNCLKRGEKDLYYPDDSHWNWKASKSIFETVEFD